MFAVAATTTLDHWTIVLGVLTVLFGGVLASLAGTWLANRHDRAERASDREHERDERYRERRMAASDDVLRALAAATSALVEADRRVDRDRVPAGPSDGGRMVAERLRQTDAALDELALHVQRLVIVSPPETLRDPGLALVNAARAVESAIRDKYRGGPQKASERDNLAGKAFFELSVAGIAFQEALRKVIHPPVSEA